MILTPLQDWGKLIVAKGFKKLPKVQNIAQSGHTWNDNDSAIERDLKQWRTQRDDDDVDDDDDLTEAKVVEKE